MELTLKNLKFTFKSAVIYQKVVGESLFSAFGLTEDGQVDTQKLDLEKLARLVWVGWLRDHPKLTFEEALEALDNYSFAEVINAIGEALAESMPESQDESSTDQTPLSAVETDSQPD